MPALSPTMKLFWIVRVLFWLGMANQVWTFPPRPVNPYYYNQSLQYSGASGKPNTTDGPHPSGGDTYPSYVGFIATAVAVLFYGSNFVPIKKYETGDGVFFQWILCIGILLTGLVVQTVRQSTFYPIVMLGGVIWSTANMCVVPIFKTLGMGLGMCIWGMFNLLGGWASGRFGWFGIDPEVPRHQALNFVGVALAVSSSVLYMFVKSTVTTPAVELVVDVSEPTERQPLVQRHTHERPSRSHTTPTEGSNTGKGIMAWLERLSPVYKLTIGVLLSMVSGFMYGINFAPAIHVQDRVVGASQNSLDYVFAQYCGIFLTSSFYFLAYSAVKRNHPVVYPEVILPAIVSGVMWAIATGCWFIANKALSEPVAFPIISTVPGAIASLFWGVFVFKEIKGRKNILILLGAVSVTTAGAILAGISK
ncbi:hypothetical protein ACOMHN_048904 [Nucella lapillus]